ncbi:GNAT family N-acetyltransferase [Nocardioides houyundeii]|uniref:GNAT family N-acetyltransferase n=1 Tax=Nocardioides houyundeii TaxID=2045452 RepID=UPI001F08845F|nr:GNAT family N-acetyltransferase [Nocardioides houyundeii]
MTSTPERAAGTAGCTPHIERRAFDHPDAVRLVAQVQAEYVVRYGGPDEAPIDAGEFAEGRGAFFVGYLGPEPVATGAWRWHAVPVGMEPGPCAEIKRMYVAAEHRQRGLARLMLARLEESAREAGVATMILETGTRQPEAIALYESAGYVPVAGYGYYAGGELSRCFGKTL